MSHASRLAALRDRFRADVPGRLDEIERLLKVGDRDQARRTAHNLKGTARSLEVELGDQAATLEALLSGDGSAEAIATCIRAIRESVEP